MRQTHRMLIEDGKTLGSALRMRRTELGLTQAQVASACGFSIRLVSEIENGRDSVGYGKILRYAGFLDADIVFESGD